MSGVLPLHGREPDAVVFRMPGRAVSAANYAADARHLAAMLPDGAYAINLCQDRYGFAVGFAAALLRGHTTLLASDRLPDRLLDLGGRYPGAYAMTDPDCTVALPSVAVPPPGNGRAEPPAVPAGQVAAIVFTSGSTGAPVAHAKSWESLVERSRDAAFAFGLQQPASIIGTVPPQHMYGFETTVLLPLHAPAASWCGPAFYPADVRSALAAAPGPRVLVTTPLQLRALHGAGRPGDICRVISATAPLDTALAGAVERDWDTAVSEIFGATEIGSIACRRTLAGAAWMPYPGVRLLPDGEGVMVSAPGLPSTPLDDVIEMLPGGQFRLLGRRTDVVKLGGRRASLSGLNQVLTALEGVQDGAFLPPVEGDARARMTAVVVAPGQARDAILAGLRSRIDPVFLPRRIIHVDRLPRNEMGKLPLPALRAMALVD